MFFVVAACLLLPLSAFAFGGHDGLVCSGCHSIHTAKDTIIFAVPQNKVDVNPKTKQRGDLLVKLIVKVPKTADKEILEAAEKMDRYYAEDLRAEVRL